MRTLRALTIALAVGGGATGIAWGQAQTPQPKRAPAGTSTAPAKAAPVDPNAIKAQQLALEKSQRELNELLAEWETRSQQVTSLDVLFDRVDKMGPAWGDVYYQGRAYLKSPDLACLQFQKYKVGDDGKKLEPEKLEPDPTERIVCTGKEVLQYQWDEKIIYVFPLGEEGRQKALLQGPLPFLFNMKAAEAKKRYGMTLLGQNESEYLIGIAPREKIDQDSFSKAFLWLNKKTFLPNKLRLHPVGDKEQQEFRFRVIEPNKALDSRFFAPTIYAGWHKIDNPGGDGPTPGRKPGGNVGAGTVLAPQGQAQPGRAGQQPALRRTAAPR